jgi:hypothetical protein
VTQVDLSQQAPGRWSNDGLDRGVIDLYARRMAVVAEMRAEARKEELERIVVTQPFGRPFTAQPSSSPAPPGSQGGFAGLRRKLAGSAPAPRRKLATP